jgi:hypothetical protein
MIRVSALVYLSKDAHRRYDTNDAVRVQKRIRIFEANAIGPASHKVTRGVMIRQKIRNTIARWSCSNLILAEGKKSETRPKQPCSCIREHGLPTDRDANVYLTKRSETRSSAIPTKTSSTVWV